MGKCSDCAWYGSSPVAFGLGRCFHPARRAGRKGRNGVERLASSPACGAFVAREQPLAEECPACAESAERFGILPTRCPTCGADCTDEQDPH